MSIYQDCYELIQTYLFGGSVLTSNQDLIAVTLSSVATVAVFALPFVIVWKVIKVIARI